MVDKGHQAWRRKLQHYIQEGDREIDPCFVGRGEVFALVDGVIDSATRRKVRGRTVVISGAPGAGKTSFLDELAKREGEKATALPVYLPPGRFTALGLFETLSEKLGEPTDEGGQVQKSAGGKVGLGGLGVQGQLQETDHRLADAARIERHPDAVPWDVLHRRFDEALSGRVVLLLCDDAQTVEKSRSGYIVGELHQGEQGKTRPFPIVTVYAGLGNTAQNIRDCASTRLTAGVVPHNVVLGRMTAKQSEMYARDTLTYFDGEGPPKLRTVWERWLAANGDRWPRHQRAQMMMVADEMLRVGSPDMTKLDHERIVAHIVDERRRYYAERVEATKHPGFASVMRGVVSFASKTRPNEESILNKIEETLVAYPSSRTKPDAEDFLREVTRAGLLHRSDDGTYGCPIPSLENWLETGCYDCRPLGDRTLASDEPGNDSREH